MSLKKRIVIAYAKSLLKSIQKNNNGENLEISNIILKEKDKRFPDIFFIGEELLLIKTLIISSKVISEFFQNPTISEQKKLQIILDVFPGLSLSMTAFLKLLAERSHLSFLPEITNQYTNLLLSLRNSTTVKVITGSSLKENYALSFLNLLRKITKSKEIILKVFYSPRLLGGFILQYNSKSIDLSILKEFSLFFNEM